MSRGFNNAMTQHELQQSDNPDLALCSQPLITSSRMAIPGLTGLQPACSSPGQIILG